MEHDKEIILVISRDLNTLFGSLQECSEGIRLKFNKGLAYFFPRFRCSIAAMAVLFQTVFALSLSQSVRAITEQTKYIRRNTV